jgi:hypothetical protein
VAWKPLDGHGRAFLKLIRKRRARARIVLPLMTEEQGCQGLAYVEADGTLAT